MRTGYTQIDEWPAEWMRYNDRLTRELGDTGYRPRQRVFTSLQVELIFRYLGRP